MKITILTDCYFPSTKSISFLIRDLAVEFKQNRGHEVTILTSDPFITAAFEDSFQDGLRVVRVKAPATKGRWLVIRALLEVLQPWVLWWNARVWFATNPQECLIYYSPSAFWAPLVRRLKSLWSCRAYMIQRDIFPEWLVQLELVTNPFAIAALKALTHDQYTVADTIGAQSQKDVLFLKNKLSNSAPSIELLYNWRSAGESVKPDPQFRSRYGYRSDDTVFFFGGTFSASQSTEEVMKIVEILGEKSDRLRFFFLGGGSTFQQMKDTATEKKLRNVTFEKSLPLADYLKILASCDVGCLSLDARYRFDNIPGRALDYMLCKKPILAALNPTNEFIQTINQKQMGIALPIHDLKGVANAALKLAEDPKLRLQMGQNADKQLRTLFSPARAADQIEASLSVKQRKN